MQNNIKKCLKDLKVDTFANKRDLENIMNLTHQRTNDYSQINDMLKKMVLKMMIGLSHWMVMILHV